MNKQQLENQLDLAFQESARLRIAIMRAVGRDPYGWPPPDDELIAELSRLTSVPADRPGVPPQTDSVNTVVRRTTAEE